MSSARLFLDLVLCCESRHEIGVVCVCFSEVAANWKSGHDLSVVCEEGIVVVDQRSCATY